MTTSGIPERLHPGFWDNVGHCCGSAGVADFMVGLSAATDDPQWRDFAWVVLDDICDRAVIDEAGARWHNIDHRNAEPSLPAQTGFMQGASGVAVALLRGARALRGGPLGPWLPPWPFPGGSS